MISRPSGKLPSDSDKLTPELLQQAIDLLRADAIKPFRQEEHHIILPPEFYTALKAVADLFFLGDMSMAWSNYYWSGFTEDQCACFVDALRKTKDYGWAKSFLEKYDQL